jgi:hypothetical protein
MASAAGLVTSPEAWAQNPARLPSTVSRDAVNWRIVSADAGFGVPGAGAQQGDVLLLQGGNAGARTLYRMPWVDSHSDRLGHGGEEPILLRAVGANAADPLVPVRDGPFWLDSARWLLWREGAMVHALGTAGEQQTLTLPETPAALLRPALQRSGDDILVMALSANRRRLDQLGFSRTAKTPPRLLSAIALPLPVRAGTAAFAAGAPPLIALSAATPTGTTVLLLHTGQAATPRMVALSGATLVPDAPPALLPGADGGALVGLLVSTDAGIALAEARFPSDQAAPATIRLRPLGRFAGKPVGGAVLYDPSADAQGRVVYLLVRLADGTLLRLGAGGALERTAFESPPVAPLVLVSRADGALVLCCDPRLGPFMAEA